MYWIQQQAKFPLLVSVVKDILSAPVWQAYLENLFTACDDLTARKHHKQSKKLEIRAFLKVSQKYA